MDVTSLSSTLIFPNSNNKPFHDCLFLPLSKNGKRVPQYVSCRARNNLASEVEEPAINGTGNFYNMLSLSPRSATTDEIKRAYRSMARQYHPDVCRDPLRKEESTRMFVQLHAAYETLMNPVLREEYDYELGLIKSKRNDHNRSVGDERWRRKWEDQLVELKRKSNRRMAQKEGSSWGSKIRAQNFRENRTD